MMYCSLPNQNLRNRARYPSYLWLDRGLGARPLMPAMGTHWLLATSKQATNSLSLTRVLSEVRPPST